MISVSFMEPYNRVCQQTRYLNEGIFTKFCILTQKENFSVGFQQKCYRILTKDTKLLKSLVYYRSTIGGLY